MIRQNTNNKEIKKILTSIPKDTIIGEFSGRDSVAAILKILEDDKVKNILPIATFATTEYGDPNILRENYKKMLKRVKKLYGDEKTIHPLIYYSNSELWSVINGRFVELLKRKFDFYTPCIGCHAYFHLIRVPMALKLGKKIISGERESHDGRIKINQLGQSLDAYKKIASYFDVDLLIPLRNMVDGNEVEDLIGWDWQEGKAHPGCVFSGNYTDMNRKALYSEFKIQRYLDEFLVPICMELGKLLIEDENVNRSIMLEKVNKIGVI